MYWKGYENDSNVMHLRVIEFNQETKLVSLLHLLGR